MGEISKVLKDYIEETLKKIVDKPEKVNISSIMSTKSVIIQINVDAPDVGKIIGKSGRTVEALKVICLAIKNTTFPEDSRRVLLEIIEDENSNYLYNNNNIRRT